MRKKVKRKKKTSFKQIKNKKSWFKLVQVGLFRYFFANLFPIFKLLLLPLRPNISLSKPQIT